MRDPENIRDIAWLSPDYMGFIYYPLSRRFAADLSPADIGILPENIRKTGVFVNSTQEEVLSIVGKMNFQAVQLHGHESPSFCNAMKEKGLEVIKVFSIAQDGGFDRIGEYMDFCDFFLFDTAGDGYGGTGKKFDWKRLSEYSLEKGFFLSGGLTPGDLEGIQELDHPQFYGIDLNSGFETAPGVKNKVQLAQFMKSIRGVGPA